MQNSFVQEEIIRASESNGNHPRIRIKLEKPTAVMFADAPAIEIVVDCGSLKNIALERP